MAKSALGRGMDSLIPTNIHIEDIVNPGEQIKLVDVHSIFPNPDQPRKEFDPLAIEELAQSISRHGILQPIIVTPDKDNSYRIIAGERRFRAAGIAGLSKVPVIIRNHEALEELEIALVENVQRVDLSPLEQAISIMKLRDQFNLSLREIAKKLGKAETTVSNIVRLVQLPKEAIDALAENKISEGHARAILSLKGDEDSQKKLLEKIIEENLSVREAEAFCKEVKKKRNEHKSSSKDYNNRIRAIEQSTKLTVLISERKKGGLVTLRYSSEKELNTILSYFEQK